jgi:hypothetical protein
MPGASGFSPLFLYCGRQTRLPGDSNQLACQIPTRKDQTHSDAWRHLANLMQARDKNACQTARRRIQRALRHHLRNFVDLSKIIRGTQVYVYRSGTGNKLGTYEGPYVYIGDDGSRRAVVLSGNKIMISHSTRLLPTDEVVDFQIPPQAVSASSAELLDPLTPPCDTELATENKEVSELPKVQDSAPEFLKENSKPINCIGHTQCNIMSEQNDQFNQRSDWINSSPSKCIDIQINCDEMHGHPKNYNQRVETAHSVLELGQDYNYKETESREPGESFQYHPQTHERLARASQEKLVASQEEPCTNLEKDCQLQEQKNIRETCSNSVAREPAQTPPFPISEQQLQSHLEESDEESSCSDLEELEQDDIPGSESQQGHGMRRRNSFNCIEEQPSQNQDSQQESQGHAETTKLEVNTAEKKDTSFPRDVTETRAGRRVRKIDYVLLSGIKRSREPSQWSQVASKQAKIQVPKRSTELLESSRVKMAKHENFYLSESPEIKSTSGLRTEIIPYIQAVQDSNFQEAMKAELESFFLNIWLCFRSAAKCGATRGTNHLHQMDSHEKELSRSNNSHKIQSTINLERF